MTDSCAMQLGKGVVQPLRKFLAGGPKGGRLQARLLRKEVVKKDPRARRDVCGSIRRPKRGRAIMSTEIVLRNPPALTGRETDVLKSLLAGETAKLTASRLGISPKTVETYRARLKAKLNVQNTVELVRVALQSGLVV
jgi:DNA-binding CsgD family transcriptional regulator